jgi:four helix bundle protein
MFPHEKLQVYSRALDFTAQVAVLSTSWDTKHSVVDHFSRAAESIVLNLAEGARLPLGPMKLTSLDYALGSSLECAACLDVAHLKNLLAGQQFEHEKRRVCEITKMLIGLRRAWSESGESVLHEDPVEYAVKAEPSEARPLFNHERLDVYRVSLRFMRWFVALGPAQELTAPFRPVDKAATSVVLNIAEGNGRYARLDHKRFLQVAQSSAIKAAAHLDLCVAKKALAQADITAGKELLTRIGAMLARM